MIVVIGAGPGGLALARELHRAGRTVVVLDAADHVGGMTASVMVSGVRADLGSHRLHPGMAPEVLALVDDLVDLQVRRRRGRIRLGGRWLPFPLTIGGLARGLPPAVSVRAALDAAWAPARRAATDSYADVVRAGLGPTVWNQFHQPYAWKVWGTDPGELSGELARRRVSASSPGAVVRRLIAGLRHRPVYLYPSAGFGALAEALSEGLPDVRLGTKVTGLIAHDDRVIVGLADGRIITASHVFSTVPIARTAAWLGRSDLVTAAVRTRAMVLVYLTLERRPYTSYDTHYFPERHVLPTRLSEPMNFRDRPDDPRDRTVICAEVPCWEGDPVWRASDGELGLRVADDLVRSGLPAPRAVAVETRRLPSVYPVMTTDAIAAVARAEQALDAVPRVTVLGRQGLFTPDNSDHVIEMGLRAARCIGADGSFDRSAWHRARDEFRGFVVQD